MKPPQTAKFSPKFAIKFKICIITGYPHKRDVIIFAPILYLHNVETAIEFYKKAFNAKELRRRSNSDGSVHVADPSLTAVTGREI
ncbi:MAG: hypothetical protein ABI416_09025 [Ginsengibacter sp.]